VAWHREGWLGAGASGGRIPSAIRRRQLACPTIGIGDEEGLRVKLGASLALDWLDDLTMARTVTQTLDDAGFDYVSCASHILTAAPERYPDMPPYAYSFAYRELLVLFTHLAACTRSIHLRTDILILPLYPTALIARQAADLSEMSGGRFELGVGISWNEAEYAALGQDLGRRAARFEEQLEVLRLLWTTPRVTFRSEHHDFDDLGLGRLPAAAIPLWIGCGTKQTLLRRVARLGDGWMPNVDPVPHIDELRSYVVEAGRPPDAVAVAGRVTAAGDPDDWLATATRLSDAGGTDLTIWPPKGASPQEGLAAMLAAHEVIANA
jgi:probable F420-dependent oxidoreductase